MSECRTSAAGQCVLLMKAGIKNAILPAYTITMHVPDATPIHMLLPR